MPLNFPSILPTEGEQWKMLHNNYSTKSNLNGAEQIESWPGEKWGCTLNFNNLQQDKGRELAAFIASLSGRAKTFYYSPYMARHNRGNPSGTGRVAGASQTGSTLSTDGWTPGITAFRVGDYFSVNDELKIVTADAIVAGDGTCTLEFAPNLRTSPPNNTVIEHANPRCIMRLADDNQSSWQESQARYYTFNLSFVEAI